MELSLTFSFMISNIHYDLSFRTWDQFPCENTMFVINTLKTSRVMEHKKRKRKRSSRGRRRRKQEGERERRRRNSTVFLTMLKKAFSFVNAYPRVLLRLFNTVEDIFSKYSRSSSFIFQINKSINYSPPGLPKILQETMLLLDSSLITFGVLIVIIFHGKCKCPRDLQSCCVEKKMARGLGYFSQVLWNTNETTTVLWKM